MHRFMRVSPIVIAFAFLVPAFGQNDEEGAKEYPGLNRMPGYYIRGFKEAEFDSHTFKVKEGGQDKEVPVEGHLYDYRFDRKDGGSKASALQIIRNFQNAVRTAGGQPLWENGEGDDRETTLRFMKGGKEVWLAVHAMSGADTVYFLTIIEKQPMQQNITLDPGGMARDIAEMGRVAVYGIYFDTGKSDLKPESDTAISEIAKLLTGNAGLKVCIVGHTDMVADFALNMKLSQARAQSVVNALVSKHGIGAARLVPFGAGPYAPVASNKTEDGRAKNRRVELVEIATNQ